MSAFSKLSERYRPICIVRKASISSMRDIGSMSVLDSFEIRVIESSFEGLDIKRWIRE